MAAKVAAVTSDMQDGRNDNLPTLQLLLFELEQDRERKDGAGQSRSRTNTVGLYDIAPRFVFYPGKVGESIIDRTESKGDPIQREFEYKGRAFRLTLKPAVIPRRARVEDGAEDRGQVEYWDHVFPGEREQIVEHVVRRLATERGRLALDAKDQLTMRFSLYEIQKELERVKRTLSIVEIREALTILHQSFVEIRGKGKGGSVLLSSTAFPALGLRGRGTDSLSGAATETYLTLNPMVAESIRSMSFRMMSYGWLMRLKNPVSRWLFNRLTVEFEDAEAPAPAVINARSIVRDSGMNEWSRPRDTLRAVREAVLALQNEGILEAVDVEKIMSGRRLDDENYTMTPSQQFLHEIEAASALAERNQQQIAALDPDGEGRGDFIRISRPAAADLRRKRRSETALLAVK